VVRAQAVDLNKTAAVEQNVETLARQKLALFMLAAGAFGAAASFGLVVEFAEFVEIVSDRHREKFLRRESKIVSPASRGIITKALGLSTELREFTRKNLQFQS
jgi:hypothetical protein